MRRIVNCRISKKEAEEVDVDAHKLLNQSRKINKTLPERLYDLTDWVKSRIYSVFINIWTFKWTTRSRIKPQISPLGPEVS